WSLSLRHEPPTADSDRDPVTIGPSSATHGEAQRSTGRVREAVTTTDHRPQTTNYRDSESVCSPPSPLRAGAQAREGARTREGASGRGGTATAAIEGISYEENGKGGSAPLDALPKAEPSRTAAIERRTKAGEWLRQRRYLSERLAQAET